MDDKSGETRTKQLVVFMGSAQFAHANRMNRVLKSNTGGRCISDVITGAKIQKEII